MKRIAVLFIVISVFLVSACEKVIPFNAEYQKSRLVVNTVFKKDSVIKVNLSSSRIIVDDAPISSVSGADIKLYKEGVFLENLTEVAGMYISTYHAEEGVNYALEVSASGFDDVTAETTMPYAVPIVAFDTLSAIDENGGRALDFSLTFTQNPNKNEYFVLQCENQNYQEIDDEGFYGNSSPDYLYVDSKDVIVEGYGMSGALFSDRLIETNTYTFKGTVNTAFISDTMSLKFRLISVNKDFFDYLTSLDKHSEAQGDPLMEPVTVYSNISSGMGIMGGAAIMETESVVVLPDDYSNYSK